MLRAPLPGGAPGRREIHDRSGLLQALGEASELEHGLLVQYLFAAFTIRTRPGSGVTESAAELARGWKRAVLIVAREEMVHLGLVSNMLLAFGGQASFRRPSLPVANRYFPHEGERGREFVVFTLERFSRDAVARFVRFERPETEAREIAPVDYDTIGELYGKIAGFIADADEHELFVGARRRQEADAWGNDFKLDAVIDRAAALNAIRRIVEEGEGAGAASATSHHARFIQIQSELDDRPPVWPAGPNPVSSPRDVQHGLRVTQVIDPGSLELMRLFDRLYLTTLMLLELLYRFPSALRPARPELRDWIRRSMSGIVRPIGETLVQLPSGVAGVNAGPGFELEETFLLTDDVTGALAILYERLEEDAAAAATLTGGALSARREIAQNIALLARGIGHLRTVVRP